MSQSPAAIFAKIIRKSQDAVAKVFEDNIEALVGAKIDLALVKRDTAEMGQLFGDRDLYIFPIEDHGGTPFPSLLAFDLEAAVHLGGSFSLMGPEQIKEVIQTGDIPEILHDSVGEVANIICGAAVNMIRQRAAEAPQFRRGAGFKLVKAGPYPSLLAEFGPRIPWEIVACRLSMGGESRGSVFFAASDGVEGMVTKEMIEAVAGPGPEFAGFGGDDDDDVPLIPDGEPATDEADDEPALTPVRGAASGTPEPAVAARGAAASGAGVGEGPAPTGSRPSPLPGPVLEGVRTLVAGNPADPAAAALRSALEGVGAKVMPGFQLPNDQVAPPDALFVVSRSPVDLGIRLERVSPARRPALVVACSDRPTRDLVVAARTARADDFLVLPAAPDRLKALLAKVPASA